MENIEYKYVAPALLTALLMSVGQIMFSFGARSLDSRSIQSFIHSTLTNGILTAAIALYAVTILTWIYTLKHLPLSFAYPITACAYIITPLLASVLLGEPLPAKLLFGSTIILLGLAVIYI
jgi:undecaprenyl phosphate-alpha-L-ara4N flippase subunit ArnE